MLLSCFISIRFDMKRFLFVFCATLVAFPVISKQLAFPGAEGFGRYATGGRMTDVSVGSKVYYVTSLEDCSDSDLKEGTLRWALRTGDDTPRTILFKVGGTINLTSVLKFEHPNVSILGQSAPGGGICISGAKMYICKKNVIVRYLRFRAGDEASKSYPSLDVENAGNLIIDHCSFSWSMEENITMYDNDSTTLQWSILSEPLNYSKNIKGERCYAAQWGGEHSSYHHNLMANAFKRIPQINGVRSDATSGHDFHVDQEMINNVVFNGGGSESAYNGALNAPNVPDAYCRLNMINNYYKPGPITYAKETGAKNHFYVTIYNNTTAGKPKSQWYVNGNVYEKNDFVNSACDFSSINADNWLNVNTNTGGIKFKYTIPSGDYISDYRLTAPSVSSGIVTTSAEQAYADVLSSAGARFPSLDEVDARILAEAAGLQQPQFTGAYKPTYTGMIDSQEDLKPAGADATWSAWPDLSAFNDETVPVDSDGDGMPDEYELANGFDIYDATDGAAIASNGYSNLENFLNGMLDSALPAPSNLTATYDEGLSSVLLKWRDHSVSETAFVLERADITPASDTVFVLLDEVPADVTNYADATADPSSKYIYRLKAKSGSSVSNTIRHVFYPSVASGIYDVANEVETLRVGPNPVSDLLVISAAEPLRKVEVNSLSGKTALSFELNDVLQTLNLASLPKGIYLLRVHAVSGHVSALNVLKQ